jgi:acyl-CoA synthetase (NDP forming)
VTSAAEIASAVARGAGTVPKDKPVLCVFLSSGGAPAALATGRRGRLPSYSFPENAARALAAAERYARWRARPRGRVVHLEDASRRTLRGVVERALSGRADPVWLDPADVESVLRAAGILLQREVKEGVEALVGVVTDPTFGPLLVSGLGGVQGELLRDASFRLPPVSDLDAAEMIDRLRLRALFDGHRGSPPADRSALIGLIQRVSALVETLPELREVDLNPVKVLRPGQGAVVVDARIRVGRVAELA